MSGGPALTRSQAFGPVAPTLGWTPPVRYLLRRERVLRLLARLPVGDALEVGCGAGALTDELAHAGWQVLGVESSVRAYAIAEALRDASGGQQRLAMSIDEAGGATFDLVCALDVLEHIEDDSSAMKDWSARLRPGGHLVLSVPAHPSRWSAGDEWAGHFRRYSRQSLLALLAGCGLAPLHIECYGFPLANMSEAFGAPVYRRLMRERAEGTTKAAATAESGIERRAASRLFRWLCSPLGRAGLWCAQRAQGAAAGRDWGSGYLVLARRT